MQEKSTQKVSGEQKRVVNGRKKRNRKERRGKKKEKGKGRQKRKKDVGGKKVGRNTPPYF